MQRVAKDQRPAADRETCQACDGRRTVRKEGKIVKCEACQRKGAPGRYLTK